MISYTMLNKMLWCIVIIQCFRKITVFQNILFMEAIEHSIFTSLPVTSYERLELFCQRDELPVESSNLTESLKHFIIRLCSQKNPLLKAVYYNFRFGFFFFSKTCNNIYIW